MNERERKRFYDSGAWKHKRQKILRRDHHQCRKCRERIARANEEGIQLIGWQRHINRATCVHHIQELQDHPELALDDDNLLSLCDRCHNEIHGRTVDKIFTRPRPRKKKVATEERW